MTDINLSLFDAETRKYIKNGSMIFDGSVEDLFDSNPHEVEEDYDDDTSGLDNTKYEVIEDNKFDPIPSVII